MSELDDLEEIERQTTIHVNRKNRQHPGRDGILGVSAGAFRSHPAREKPAPAPRPAAPKPVARDASVQALIHAPIRSMPELVDAIRARRDELNISHETIDNIAGLQSGYTSKLLGPIQLKGFSHMSLGAVLGALGIGLAVVEDVEQRGRVEGRWQKRKRPQRLMPSMPLSIQNEVPATMQITPELQAQIRTPQFMREIGLRGNITRNKRLSPWKRKVLARRAAKARWQREAAP